MKTYYLLLFSLLLGFSDISYAQGCDCGYSIDTNGDSIPDGTLYRDEVYDLTDIVALNDMVGPPGSITYSRGVELYDGTLTDLKMDVYYPSPSGDTCADSNKPVIFFFYGGGFIQGNSIRVKDLAMEYATRGFVTVAPNYRLGMNGAAVGDTTLICEDLLGTAAAAWRGLLDAQAAMRWMTDSAQIVLGLDIDVNRFMTHGPSVFGMLSHMQDDEAPGFLKSIGHLDDSLKIAGSVCRSAMIFGIKKFIDNDPDELVPMLIFQGTCDKSVPFTQVSAYDRFECDTTGIPIGATSNYKLSGALKITQKLNHFYEFYPICGLNHALKDPEQTYLRDTIARFIYDVACHNFDINAAPHIFAYKVAGCDVSGKCTGSDNHPFCDSAYLLPPVSCFTTDDYSKTLENEIISIPAADNELSINVFPNPAHNFFQVSYNSPEATYAVVSLYDAMGRRALETSVEVNKGLNMLNISATEVPHGVYFLMVNQHKGSVVVLE